MTIIKVKNLEVNYEDELPHREGYSHLLLRAEKLERRGRNITKVQVNQWQTMAIHTEIAHSVNTDNLK